MLFDTTAPSSSFWTPPKLATGKDKFLLSLMGYGADGSQNGWGKISSWIPGLNVAANNSAQITARQAGLGDVANAIGSDMDNRMQKLQAGVNVVKGAVGVATANPALIQSGVQGLTQSISGLANAQDDPTQYTRGTTAYQRFFDGGKLSVKPVGRMPEKSAAQKNVDQVTRQAQDKADMFMVANGFRPASSLTGINADESYSSDYQPVNMTAPPVPVKNPVSAPADGSLPTPAVGTLPTRSNARNFIRVDDETFGVANGQPVSSVTGVVAPGKSAVPNDLRGAIDTGTDWTRTWMARQAALGNAALQRDDMQASTRIGKTEITAPSDMNAMGTTIGDAAGYYNPNTGKSHISSANDPAYASTAATHEATHNAQDLLTYRKDGKDSGALHKTYQEISARIQHPTGLAKMLTSKRAQNYNSYLSKPEEAHARIMQLRRELNMAPDANIDRETLSKYFKGKPSQAANDLRAILSEDDIYQLLDPKKVVSTQRERNDGQLYAASGGKLPGENRYPASDKVSEDAVIIDKATGQKLGEMRHGERVFDQDATRTMEALVDRGDHASLGRFVLAEMLTHPDYQDRNAVAVAFAGGGKLTGRPVGRLPEKDKAQRYAEQSAFNRRIDEQMFNAINGYAPLSSYTGIQAGSQPVPVPVDRPAPILPDPTGNDIPEVTVSGKRTTATQRPYTMLPEGAASAASLTGMADRVVAPPVLATPAVPSHPSPATPATTATSEKVKKAGGGVDWWGMGSDALRAVTAAIGAGQPLPTRPVNPNLQQMSRELADRQNEGLSGLERTNLLRQQADQQGRDVQMIRDTIGGGGNANAVLAAVGAASDRSNAMTQQIEGVDRSQRQQNRENYYRDLIGSQAGSDAIFAQQYAQAVQQKGAFAQAMAANLQSMADRSQYDKAYGEGSTYHDLMTQLLKRTGSRRDYADAPVTSLTPKLP
ncbi:hypothetical protein CLV58_12559 [Spirosoma oryzae]|uniref:Uncharacterized protein n=1 Tax=Spirosoma oryzae TaxID=1469603 RepID=A0A2T0S8N5_9BACT|nr:hypothetical protein [Spirosoma oryzae]PRY29797.1 hypothetical protein CLV58_12559 [Spirosoma oryzae]